MKCRRQGRFFGTNAQDKLNNTWFRGTAAKRVLLMLLDAASVLAAYLATLAFRFGGKVPENFLHTFRTSIVFIILIYLLVNALFRLYSMLWEHASIDELVSVVIASVTATVLCYVLAVLRQERMPRSIYIAAGLVIILLHGGLRMGYRVLRRFSNLRFFAQDKARALIVGAGDTASMAVSRMQEDRAQHALPVCIVTAEAERDKRGARLHGVRIVGGVEDIPALVKKYEITQIIYAMPEAGNAMRRRILEICAETGCEMKMVPAMEDLRQGKLYRMRDVDVSDLLARPVVALDTDAISGYLTDSVVLVTGGGGSIGSELCRQIARFAPAKLVVYDIYENNAYELYVDMKRQYGTALDMEIVIGSVRDVKRLDEVFAHYKPDVVFHAAAHKHVPLMETSPVEAVKNNVNGTFNVAKAADISGVKRFVLISTDKAVNPTNIMGASKYLCELIVQYMNQRSQQTAYVTVRFGNVLGSNGSVVPLFRRQIEAGGPVTVTDKEVTRYFMTIPEAAQLVIQAGSMAKEGEVFLLDMGEPVRIDDFARTFIRLSGYEPDVDIPIVYTGLRPGEKMYEELWQQSETEGESAFPGILIGKTHPISAEEIKRRIDYLRARAEADPDNIRTYLAEVVPTYHEAGAIDKGR